MATAGSQAGPGELIAGPRDRMVAPFTVFARYGRIGQDHHSPGSGAGGPPSVTTPSGRSPRWTGRRCTMGCTRCLPSSARSGQTIEQAAAGEASAVDLVWRMLGQRDGHVEELLARVRAVTRRV